VEGLLWSLKTFDPFTLAWPVCLNLVLFLAITQSDFAGLILAYSWSRTRDTKSSFRPLQKGTRPSALVVIPSLLRDAGDLNAITTTIESAGNNGYPDEITIVASVDGRTEKPALYRELLDWVAAHTYPENVHVHVTGTETRLGKMMAVEAGVAFMKACVAQGLYAKFPALYISIDGDGTRSSASRTASALHTRSRAIPGASCRARSASARTSSGAAGAPTSPSLASCTCRGRGSSWCPTCRATTGSPPR
jgi:hypothetical protein